MLLSPRIGFNVYPNDKKNTQFRGGIGVFTGRTPYVWISNQYSNTGMDLGRNYITSNVPFFNTDPYDQPVSSTPTGQSITNDASQPFPLYGIITVSRS